MLTDILTGDIEDIYSRADTEFRKSFSEDMLRRIREELKNEFGAFQVTENYTSRTVNGLDFVFLECRFESRTLIVKFIFSSLHQLSGLFFLPYSGRHSIEKVYPEYVNPVSFTESDTFLPGPILQIPVRTSVPNSGKVFPAVILVPGTGPQDMDETIGENKPFRDIAWGLASAGICVIRYDKRTKVYKDKQMRTQVSSVFEEYIEDILKVIDYAQSRDYIGKKDIYLLGHSFGGTILPSLTFKNSEIRGLILMSALAKRLEDAVRDQLIYLESMQPETSPLSKDLKAIKEQVEQLKNEGLNGSLLGMPSEYWEDLENYYPIPETLKETDQRFLILQGGHDFQITPENLAIWKELLKEDKNAIFKYYDTLNHLLIKGKGDTLVEEFFSTAYVDGSVIADIIDFIKQDKSSY